MADIGAKIAQAKKAGYSDAEISAYLAKDGSLGPKIQEARQAGYGDKDILGHLLKSSPEGRALEDARRNIRSADKVPGADSMIARVRGATLGFLDEGQGAVNALATGARNLVGQGPGYGMKDAYSAGRQASLEQERDYAKRHPVDNAVEQLAGGAWVPGAKYIGNATSLGQAAIRSAQVGGAIGAVAGLGNADTGKRIRGAVTGAAVGAAVGGAAPYIARGAQEVAKRVGSAATEASDQVRLGFGGELADPSPKQVGRANENALAYVKGIAKRSPNALEANPVELAGKPITAAEALGRPAVTELGSIARRSGKTGEALESTLRQRQVAMPDRVLTDLSEATGLAPEAINGDFTAHAKALRAKAAPLYDAAYTAQAPDSPKVEALFRRPSMKLAMKRAYSIAQEEGRDPTVLGLQDSLGPGKPKTVYETKTVVKRGSLGEPIESQQQVPLREETAVEPVFSRRPTYQTLDYIKRGIDDVLEGYRDSTTGKLRLDERGRAVLATLNEYRRLIAPQGSAYRAALDAGGEPIRLEQAFNSAKTLMSNNTPMRVFEQRFAGLSPAEQEAHVAGFVNSAYEGAQSGRLKLRDMQSPLFQKKLTLMLGPERADALLSQVANEAALARTGSRMSPGVGSPTMEFQAAAREQDDAAKTFAAASRDAFKGKPVSAALRLVGAPITGAYRGARAPIDRATRDEVGRLLQLSPSELDAVLKQIEAGPIKYRPPNTAAVSNALARSTAGTLAKQ